MAKLLLMPEVATGDGEAVLSSWVVAVGAPFGAADTIAVVETAKAAVDIDAGGDGVILRTLVAEGAEVSVGEPIALLGAVDEVVGDVDQVLAELGVTDGARGTPPPAVQPAGKNARPATAVDGAAKRIFASPLARKQAREAGLDLAELVGTGPNGRIVRDDVRAALARRASAAPIATARTVPTATANAVPAAMASAASAVAPQAGRQPNSTGAAAYTEVPHSRLRQAIARRLTESVTTAPHFFVSGVANVDRLLALRAEINDSTGTKVSVNDLVVKAVAHAHTVVPAMNVIWTADTVRRFASVDVAVAVATDVGLVTPVVRGIERLGIAGLATATRDLAERARAGRLHQHELEGGTISVTNLGMYGTREFSAIINPPHASILAVGAAVQEPVVVDGRIEVASVLRLTLSVDHRPVDGTTAAEWMRALVDILERPLGLLVGN
jgi:pyruvate dehydrogenase E2 component (dihydrolipoamide acetyltransferase)